MRYRIWKFILLSIGVLLMAPTLGAENIWLQFSAAVALLVAIVASTSVKRKSGSWNVQQNGGVSVTLTNGQLGGTLQTNDGVMGLVLTGTSESGGYVAGTPILVTGLPSLTAAGISQTGNPFAYRHVTEYYNEVGNGATLYLMLVPPSMTVAQMALNTNANGAVALLNFAQGAIKVLGILADDAAVHTAGGTVTISNGLNADVYTAASNIAVTAQSYFAQQWPFRAIIGGSSYSGTASALTTVNSGTTNNRSAILIGDTLSYNATYSSAAIGLLLGKIASIPVQRKISRVKDGALTNTSVYLHTSAYAGTGYDNVTIAGKGFITFTQYANVSGFFFSGDPMLTATTDDYCMLARGRVIDKAQILAYATYIQEVDDEIPTAVDGTIDPGFAKYLQQQVINQISNTMVAQSECSGVDCYIDPGQNILSTNTLNIVLKVRPVGYSTYINISLGFEQ
jgi:hypothetical protein